MRCKHVKSVQTTHYDELGIIPSDYAPVVLTEASLNSAELAAWAYICYGQEGVEALAEIEDAEIETIG